MLAALGQGIRAPIANCLIHLALAVGSGALIAALALSPLRLLSMILCWSPALGTISYGVYLLHKPVVGTLLAALGQPSVLPNTDPAALLLVVGVILTTAIAAASWRWFESPMIHWGHRITSVEVAAAHDMERSWGWYAPGRVRPNQGLVFAATQKIDKRPAMIGLPPGKIPHPIEHLPGPPFWRLKPCSAMVEAR